MQGEVEEPEKPVEVTFKNKFGSHLLRYVKDQHLLRYVKDRLPGIEEADLNEEETVRQLMHECQV